MTQSELLSAVTVTAMTIPDDPDPGIGDIDGDGDVDLGGARETGGGWGL